MEGVKEVVFYNPIQTIVGWFVSYGEPYSSVGNGRASLEAHHVVFGPVLNDGAIGVVVLVPEET